MALKALSKNEELAAIPGDQPVLVQLPGFDDAPEADAADDKGKKTDLKVVDSEDAGVKTLKDQLEALKTANAEERKRDREQLLEANRRAEKAEQDRVAALADKAETESEAVTSGLAAAQAEQESAKAALKAAGEAGDWAAMGDANARIGRAAADIRDFERAAATLADEKKRAPTEDQRQAPQRQMSVNEAIDSNPQLLDAERTWLKAHPEAILDPARNKELDVAYVRATREGLSRGTQPYFDYIEKFMGYTKTDQQQQDGDMTVSAPPSRNERGGDGKPTGGKIMLTPEERDLAKSMGVTDIDYARQKANFETARKADPEKYR